jgi:prevent-host-death family protein
MYKLGMTKISTAEARKHFTDLMNRAHYGKQRIALTRHGSALAAVIPIEDLHLLEKLEELRDAEEARQALADAKAKGEKPVTWASSKKRLGL